MTCYLCQSSNNIYMMCRANLYEQCHQKICRECVDHIDGKCTQPKCKHIYHSIDNNKSCNHSPFYCLNCSYKYLQKCNTCNINVCEICRYECIQCNKMICQNDCVNIYGLNGGKRHQWRDFCSTDCIEKDIENNRPIYENNSIAKVVDKKNEELEELKKYIKDLEYQIEFMPKPGPEFLGARENFNASIVEQEKLKTLKFCLNQNQYPHKY